MPWSPNWTVNYIRMNFSLKRLNELYLAMNERTYYLGGYEHFEELSFFDEVESIVDLHNEFKIIRDQCITEYKDHIADDGSNFTKEKIFQYLNEEELYYTMSVENCAEWYVQQYRIINMLRYPNPSIANTGISAIKNAFEADAQWRNGYSGSYWISTRANMDNIVYEPLDLDMTLLELQTKNNDIWNNIIANNTTYTSPYWGESPLLSLSAEYRTFIADWSYYVAEIHYYKRQVYCVLNNTSYLPVSVKLYRTKINRYRRFEDTVAGTPYSEVSTTIDENTLIGEYDIPALGKVITEDPISSDYTLYPFAYTDRLIVNGASQLTQMEEITETYEARLEPKYANPDFEFKDW